METPAPTRSYDLLIDVLGTRFSITVGEDPAYLEEVLTQYEAAIANTQNISGLQDPLKAAILTGFLLCDEVNKIKLQNEEEQKKTDTEMNRIMGNIMARIEQVIDG